MKEAEKLSSFKFKGAEKDVNFTKTVITGPGTTCDIYSFEHDNSYNLAITKIAPGCRTSLQVIYEGDETIVGRLSGTGSLTIFKERDKNVLIFKDDYVGRLNARLSSGDVIRWHAMGESPLVVYEIFTPPYMENRYTFGK